MFKWTQLMRTWHYKWSPRATDFTIQNCNCNFIINAMVTTPWVDRSLWLSWSECINNNWTIEYLSHAVQTDGCSGCSAWQQMHFGAWVRHFLEIVAVGKKKTSLQLVNDASIQWPQWRNDLRLNTRAVMLTQPCTYASEEVTSGRYSAARFQFLYASYIDYYTWPYLVNV